MLSSKLNADLFSGKPFIDSINIGTASLNRPPLDNIAAYMYKFNGSNCLLS